ncbi:MAG TPA: hypothetical protein VKD90_07680, partial [Gemmataceae bacterium]|nr:hypothetical protein [Gemmataceae bacterium]
MPFISCPHCEFQIQFPDVMATSLVACPRTGCGKPVQLPHADGTPYVPRAVPSPPPLPSRPEPAVEYFLRKPTDPDLVVGPLPRGRLKKMSDEGKLRREDELSANRQHWWRADHIDPELFGLPRPRDRQCPTCGAKLAEGEFCLGCAGPDAAAGPVAAAPVAARPDPSPLRQERVLSAPQPLDDIAAARSAGDVLGVTRDGWLGLWSVDEGKRVRTWEFEPGKSARLAVADEGGFAVLAVTRPKFTRLYLVDFELRRLGELTDFDGGIQALGISPDGRQVGFVDDGPDVRVYQVDPWKRLDKFAVEGTRFAFGLAADRLAAADDAGRVFVWDLRDAAVEWELMHGRKDPACPRQPLRMDFTRSGGRLLVATGEVNDPPTRSRAQLERSTTLRSWDLKTGSV